MENRFVHYYICKLPNLGLSILNCLFADDFHA
ncbi:unnamed protein product [Cuscuta epithymum]|uniref:Uncharacterized protein n=1 Tax=Cuscuta epithymum TaxID=186058 RepID=A0AAV0G4U1_9ASTE|nr:unnamed protein product [Cuscuta epithymum]